MIPDLIIDQALINAGLRTTTLPSAEVIRSAKLSLRGIFAAKDVIQPNEIVPPALYKRDYRERVVPKSVRRHAGTKAKFLKAGRTDPSAEFQHIPLSAAADIDCHKSKAKKSSAESPEIRQLLDDWERRTGKIAPSRRRK